MQDVGEYKIHPRGRFVASPLQVDSNLRDLILQTGNVRKRPFETGRTTGLRSLPTMLNLTARPHSGRLFGAKIRIFF